MNRNRWLGSRGSWQWWTQWRMKNLMIEKAQNSSPGSKRGLQGLLNTYLLLNAVNAKRRLKLILYLIIVTLFIVIIIIHHLCRCSSWPPDMTAGTMKQWQWDNDISKCFRHRNWSYFLILITFFCIWFLQSGPRVWLFHVWSARIIEPVHKVRSNGQEDGRHERTFQGQWSCT